MSRLFTTANQLTLFRIAVIPVFVALFLTGRAIEVTIAYLILCWGETSDIIDGYVARARNESSKIGALLDPLADTLSRFCFFLTYYAVGLAPLWTIFAFFIRDMVVSYMRSFSAAEGVVMGARQSGKIKAMFQAAATMLIGMFVVFRHQDEILAMDNGRALITVMGVAGGLGPLASIFIFRLGGVVRTAILILVPVLAGPLVLMGFVRIPQLDWVFWSNTIMSITAAFTLYTGVEYAIAFWSAMKDKLRG
ncbi:MAG: CDP-diacylglycerol--glycerol-3-phosphate 3-phosphatidyltransferase [Myxococcota bacterium]|nr:CDP-diacylglycerol--glycerol-3-phosphate 3-phosphatidyltransferase [Myxococcota bacterium]